MQDSKSIQQNKQTEKQFIANYDVSKYDRPSVTVDMLVFTVTEEDKVNYRKLPEKALRLLMIKRGGHPFLGQWALPGGFVEMNESLDDAAERELKEETSIDHIYMEQLYTYGDIGRDPRTRVISTAYMSLVDSTLLNIQANDDAEDAMWFTVSFEMEKEQKIIRDRGYIIERCFKLQLTNEENKLSAKIRVIKTVEGKITSIKREVLESNEIAFDHAKIIAYAIERLQSKIEYTDIAFNLMTDLFTLTQLQQVYEAILNTKLLKANFYIVKLLIL